MIAMSQIVQGEVSTRCQDTPDIVGQHHVRLFIHSKAFERALQIRNRRKLIQRILVLFDQIVKSDKTGTRYMS